MPKKFNGVNTKAEAARERKAAAKHAAADRKRQEEEDLYWKDDDKHAARKEHRKVHAEYAIRVSVNASRRYLCLLAGRTR